MYDLERKAENTTNGNRSKSTERTLKEASDVFVFWPLKCVGVEDLIGLDVPPIRGTSDKASQEFGQYFSG